MAAQTCDDLLTAIEATTTDDQRNQRLKYDAMVRKLAAGETVTPAEARKLLTSTGRSTEALAGAVKARATRLRLAAAAGSLPGLEMTLTEQLAELAAIESQMVALEASARPIRSAIAVIRGDIHAAKQARVRLAHTCDDPDILAERSALLEQRAAAIVVAGAAEQTVRECEARAARARLALAAADFRSPHIDRLRADLSRTERELAEAKDRLTEARSAEAGFDRALEALSQRMVEA